MEFRADKGVHLDEHGCVAKWENQSMSVDDELLARMRECRDAMQEAAMSVRECVVTQKRVAEVVDMLATAYERIDERLKAIEQRIERDDEYAQEQGEQEN